MKTFLLSPEEKDPTNVSITESQIDLSFQYTQTFLINKQWNNSILMKHFKHFNYNNTKIQDLCKLTIQS